MEKYSLQKKLAAYSAFAVPFFALTHQADGQILYTDVMPDDTLNFCDTLSLDLNNDGVPDFLLAVGKDINNYWKGCMIMNESGEINSVAGVGTNTSYGYTTSHYLRKAFKLNYLDPIGNSTNWAKPKLFNKYSWCNGPFAYDKHAVFNIYFDSYGYFGYWNNNLNGGYAGLKLNISNQSYFGWIRLVVDTGATWMILKDYAIDTIPDQVIGAGQCMCPPTNVETLNSIDHEIFISPNPSSDKLVVSTRRNISIAHLRLFDLQGREQNVIWANGSSGWTGDVSTLADGAYILESEISSQVYREKILIQH